MAKNIEKIAPKFLVNFGKSVTYSMNDAFRNKLLTNTFEVVSQNEEMIRSTLDNVKNYKNISKKIENFYKNDKTIKDVKEISRNIASDLVTGKWYNKEREMRNSEAISGVDNDWSMESISSTYEVGRATVKATNNVGKAVIASSKSVASAITTTSKISNDLKIATHKDSMNALSTVNGNIGLVASFNGEVIKPFIDNANKYFNETTKLQSEIKDILFKGFEIQSKYYSNMMTIQERKPEKEQDIETILSGGFSFSAYKKAISNNIKSMLDNAGVSMLKGSGLGLMESLKANPIATILGATNLNTSFIPKEIQKSLMGFDNSLKGFMSSFLLKINDIADNGIDLKRFGKNNELFSALTGSLAKLFKIKIKKKKTVDTSKYTKGPIPFDGVTKKSITEVIPMYLRKILAALTNTEEIVYNYGTGRAELKKNVIRSYKDTVNNTSINYSDFERNLIEKNQTKLKGQDKRDYEQDVKLFLTRMEGKLLPSIEQGFNKFSEKLLDIEGFNFSNKNTVKYLYSALSNMEKIDKLNFGSETINAILSRNSQMKTLEENQEINALSQSLMDSNLENAGKINRLEDSLTNKNLNEIKDILKNGIDVYVKNLDSVRGNRSVKRNRSNQYGKTTTTSNESVTENLSYYSLSIDDGDENNTENKEEKTENQNNGSQEPKEKKETFYDKINKSVSSFLKRPVEIITKTIDKVTENMYDIIFGKEKDTAKRNKDSFFGKLHDSLKGFINNIGEKLFGKKDEDGNKEKEGLVDKIKEKLFGKTDEDGNKISKGLLSGLSDVFKDSMKSIRHVVIGKGYTDSMGVEFKDNPESVFAIAKAQIMGATSVLTDALLGPKNSEGVRNAKEGFLNTMFQSVVLPFKTFKESFFGSGDGSNVKVNDIDSKLYNEIKQASPEIARGAMTGGLVGLLTPGGPIVGALLGTGVQLVRHTDTFKTMMFGSYDENNVHDGKGIIPPKMAEWFKDKGVKIKNGAIAGGLAGLLLPGGPVIGGLLGATVSASGLVDKFKTSLFGQKDENGNKIKDGLFDKLSPEQKATMKRIGGSVAAGGVLGMFLPGGPLMGALTLTGANMLITSNRFKDAIFGKMGEDGKRDGGVIGTVKDFFNVAVAKPTVTFFKETNAKIGYWMQKSILNPVSDALAPFKKEAQLMFEGFKQRGKDFLSAINNSFAKHIGIPLTDAIQEKLIKPVTGIFKTIFGSVGRFIGGIVSSPFKLLNSASNSLRRKHVMLGEADYISADLNRIKDRDASQEEAFNKKMDEIRAEKATNQDNLNKFNEDQREKQEVKNEEARRLIEEERKNKKSIYRKIADSVSDYITDKRTKGITKKAFKGNEFKTDEDVEKVVKANEKNAELRGKGVKNKTSETVSNDVKNDYKSVDEVVNETVNETSKNVANDVKKETSTSKNIINDIKEEKSKNQNNDIESSSTSENIINDIKEEKLNNINSESSSTIETIVDSIIPESNNTTTSTNNTTVNTAVNTTKGKKTKVVKQTQIDFGKAIKKISNTTRNIYEEIRGQLNGVGWNLDRIVNLLEIKFNMKSEGDPNNRKTNRRRTGFLGRIGYKARSKYEDAKQWLGDKKDALVDKVKSPFRLIGGLYGKAKEGVVGTANFLWESAKSIGHGLIETAKYLGKGFFGALKIAGLGLLKGIGFVGKGIFKGGKLLVKGIATSAKFIWNGAKFLGKGFINGIAETLKFGGNVLKGLFSGLGEFAKKSLPLLGSAIGTTVGLITDMVSSATKLTWNLIKGAGNIIASPFKALYNKFFGDKKNKIRKTELYITGGHLDSIGNIDSADGVYDRLDSIINIMAGGTDNPFKKKQTIANSNNSTDGQILEEKAKEAQAEKEETKGLLQTIADSTKGTFLGLTGQKKKGGLFSLLLTAGGFIKKLFNKVSDTFSTVKDLFNVFKNGGFTDLLKAIKALFSKDGKQGLVKTIINTIFNRDGGKDTTTPGGDLSIPGEQPKKKSIVNKIKDFIDYKKNNKKIKLDLKNTSKVAKAGGNMAGTIGGGFFGDMGRSIGDDAMEAIGLDGTLLGDVGSTAIARKVKKVGINVSTKTTQNLIDKVMPKITNNKLVSTLTNMVTKVMSNPAVSKIIGREAVESFLSKALPRVIKEAVAKGAGKLSMWLASGGTLAIVSICADIVTGMAKADKLFTVPKGEKTSFGMKVAAGIAYAISNNLLMGIIPADWLAKTIYGAVAGEEGKKKIENYELQLEKQAEEAGMTPEAFNDQINKSFGEKAWDGIKNGTKAIWDTGKKIVVGAKNTVKKAVGWVGDKVKGAWNWLTGNGRGGENTGRRYLSGRGSANGMAYYSQKDPRWADQSFKAKNDTLNDTVGSAGCGPTAISMALSKYGVNVTPDIASKAAITGGYKMAGEGTQGSFIDDFSGSLGVPFRGKTLTSQMDVQTIEAQLASGQPVVTLGSDNGTKTPYTNTGHYLVIAGKDKNGNYLVNDPLNPSNSNKSFSPQELLNKTSAYWSTGVGGGNVSLLSGNGSDAEKVINFAKQYLGSIYAWGGKTPPVKDSNGKWKAPKKLGKFVGGYELESPGFDCSGLMQYSYVNALGMDPGASTYDQAKAGSRVSYKEKKPGDLILFSDYGHVGMYVGNEKMIHSPKSGSPIEITDLRNYWANEVEEVRRLIKNPGDGDYSSGVATESNVSDSSDSESSDSSSNNLFSNIMNIFDNAFNAVAFRNTDYLNGDPLAGSDGGDSGSTGSDAAVTNVKGNSNAEKVWNYFTKEKKFTKEATAGIMGNLQQESGIDPTKKQYGGGPGRGLVQWETGHSGNNGRGRWNHLEDWAKKTGRDKWQLETQLDYLWKELKGDAEDTYNAYLLKQKIGGVEQFGKLKDYKQALRIFEESVERAGQPMFEKRYKYAEQFLDEFGGGGRGLAGLTGRGILPKIKPSNITKQIKKLTGRGGGGTKEASSSDVSAIKTTPNYNANINVLSTSGGDSSAILSNKLLQAILNVLNTISDSNNIIASNTSEMKDKETVIANDNSINNNITNNNSAEPSNVFLGSGRGDSPRSIDKKVMKIAYGDMN